MTIPRNHRERLAIDMRERRPKSRIAWAVAVALSMLASDATSQDSGRNVQDAAAPALRPFHLNFNRFEIPFSVDQFGQRPVEVQLYVSRDAGIQWELYATQAVSGKPFLFEATADGNYWFATRTVDEHGNAAALRPQLTVRVDTTEPQVELQAKPTAEGPIAITLVCIDASPSVDSIRIEYSLDQSRQWTLISDIATRNDESQADRVHATAEFLPPASWQQISIRALVGDLAGNKTIVARQIDRPRVAAAQMRLATSKAPANTPLQSPASVPASTAAADSTAREPIARVANQSPWAVPQFSVSSGFAPLDSTLPQSSMAAADPAAGPTGPELTAPVTSQTPARAASSIPLAPANPPPRPKTAAEAMRPLASRDSKPPAAVPPATAAPASPAREAPVTSGSPPSQRAVPADSLQRPAVGGPATLDPRQSAARVASDGSADGTAPPQGQSPVAPSISADLSAANVPVRYSRSRKFSLEYEIESAGLAGVSEVELWGTTDQGQTWKRWGADPDRESPFDIETNNDGVYGFRIVVVASNGLATPRPLDGEPADILIAVDTQVPTVRITGATYGDADQTGSLVIRYQCDDANLMRRPISLAFGSSPDGPWSTIAAGLENEGVYVWPADPTLPRQIYLRIDASDMAGNVGHYVLDTPIDIQGLAPRARIRGFNPLTGSAGGVPRGGESSEQPQTAMQPKERLK